LKKKLFSEGEKIIITNLHFTKIIRIIRFMVIYLTLIMCKAKKVRKETPNIVEGSDESEFE
jgi:hypothetical protein